MDRITKHYLMIVFMSLALATGVNASPEKTVTWGSVGEPETLDPGQAWDSASVFFTTNLFDTLVRLDSETSEIVPALAVSWRVGKNGTQWVFQLRKGIRFHDGTGFNADSVVFSFQRQMEKDFPYRYYDFPLFDEIFKNLVSVEAIDTHTVVFRLDEPFYPFLATLTSSPSAIVSPAAVKKYGKTFPQNPVGTGPFRFKSWEKNKRIVMEANADYWMGRPGFDHFYRLTIDKHDQLHRLFREQEIDIIDSYSISRTAGLRNLRWATIKSIPILSLTFISFNLENRFLMRKNVRKAICSAWDPRFLKYVFQDFVDPLNSIIPKGMPGVKVKRTGSKFDMKGAQDFLQKENIKKPIRLKFLLLSDSSLERQLVSLFSKKLKQIGIELQIVSVSRGDYKQRVGEGDYDLTMYGWIADYPDPQSIISPLFNEQLLKMGFPNLAQYKDTEMEAQIEILSSEMDRAKRIQRVSDIIRRIDDLALCIPLYQNTSVIIYNNRKIENIRVTPIDTIHLFDIKKK